MGKRNFIIIIFSVLILVSAPLFLYIYIFAPISHYSFSTSDQAWSNFGSFIGGTIGTIFSFLTFLGAAFAVYYQKKQLDVQKATMKLEEIHSLLSRISERLDVLIYTSPQLYPHQYIELNELDPKMKAYIDGSFISMLAALGTFSLSKKYNKNLNVSDSNIPDGFISSLLQQSASLINIELNAYGHLLSIYKNNNGDHELVEFYESKYSALICWLNVIGLLNAPFINDHVDFSVLENVLVGNNFKDYSSSI
jgi:ABC-type multidrug transport system fused ATPase/permease subunit